MTVNQPSSVPTRKVGAAALGGAVASVGMGMLSIVAPESYALVPAGMEGGIATLSAFGLSYAVKERKI